MFTGLTGRTVNVNLDTGESFRGVVVSASRRAVRLQNVQLVSPERLDIAGVARIPSTRITWIQEV